MEHEERLQAALADRYQIEREIGSGGMATVYLAKDLKHDRQVALKVLNPDLAQSLGAERFLREKLAEEEIEPIGTIHHHRAVTTTWLYGIAVDDNLWSEEFDAAWDPTFSPDGDSLLVRAVQDGVAVGEAGVVAPGGGGAPGPVVGVDSQLAAGEGNGHVHREHRSGRG